MQALPDRSPRALAATRPAGRAPHPDCGGFRKPTPRPPWGERVLDPRTTVTQVPSRRRADGRSRPPYRRESFSRGSSAWDGSQLRLASAQPRQTPGALAFDEGTQTFADQCRPSVDSGELLGLIQQLFIEIYGGSHVDSLTKSRLSSYCASNDDQVRDRLLTSMPAAWRVPEHSVTWSGDGLADSGARFAGREAFGPKSPKWKQFCSSRWNDSTQTRVVSSGIPPEQAQ